MLRRRADVRLKICFLCQQITAKMGWKAREMQLVLDLVKCWWTETFEKYKVNGQLALEHGTRGAGRGAFLDYISAYASKGPELQLRGLVHNHVLLWRIGPEDEVAKANARYREAEMRLRDAIDGS